MDAVGCWTEVGSSSKKSSVDEVAIEAVEDIESIDVEDRCDA